jgi:hypothetical protein
MCQLFLGRVIALTVISALTVTYGCQADTNNKTTNSDSETREGRINDSEYTNDTIIFFILNTRISTDTLFVHFHPGRGDEQYSLVWGKDTIKKIFSYAKPTDFIERLDTLNFRNTFLLADDGGDGCPTVLRLLSFIRDDKHYFLSEPFGNCEEINDIKYDYPNISFYFNGHGTPNDYPYREKAKYVYNAESISLKKVE